MIRLFGSLLSQPCSQAGALELVWRDFWRYGYTLDQKGKTMIVKPDELISLIADTLCEFNAEQLCEVADYVLSAKHEVAGEDAHGDDLIKQTWED